MSINRYKFVHRRNKPENTRKKTGGGTKRNGQSVSKLQHAEVTQYLYIIASLIRF